MDSGSTVWESELRAKTPFLYKKSFRFLIYWRCFTCTHACTHAYNASPTIHFTLLMWFCVHVCRMSILDSLGDSTFYSLFCMLARGLHWSGTAPFVHLLRRLAVFYVGSRKNRENEPFFFLICKNRIFNFNTLLLIILQIMATYLVGVCLNLFYANAVIPDPYIR